MVVLSHFRHPFCIHRVAKMRKTDYPYRSLSAKEPKSIMAPLQKECCEYWRCLLVGGGGAVHTGWQRCTGCIFISLFPADSPIMSGSSAKRDLHLMASYASAPLCSPHPPTLTYNIIFRAARRSVCSFFSCIVFFCFGCRWTCG